MKKVKLLCFCVLVLIISLIRGQRRNAVSPCPNIFNYQSDEYGRIYGQIVLQPRGQQTMQIIIQINFTVPAQIFNNYYGSIDLINEKYALQGYNKGSPMTYRVNLPIQSPLPRCVSIEVNGNVICSGPRDVLQPNTYLSDFSLRHTAFIYYTTNNQPTDYGPSNQLPDYGTINQPIDYGPINQPPDYGTINQSPVTQAPVYRPPVTQAPVYRPPVTQAPVYRPPVTQAPIYRPPVTQAPVYRPPVTQAPVYKPPVTQAPDNPDDIDFNNLFGIDNNYGNSPDYIDPPPTIPKPRPIKPTTQQPITQRPPEREPATTSNVGCGHLAPLELIHQGENYKKGALPWLAAIYKRTGGTLNFKCGGTLVSDRHVITAAHCMHLRTQIYNYKDLTVKVGVYDLDEWEEGVVQVNLKFARIHKDYNPATLENDIMILLVDKRVTYTKYIRPACLWTSNTDLEAIVGNSGIVAGWGELNSGGDRANLPQMASLPIVSNNQCREKSPQWHGIISNTTLCAGDLKGTGPCKGDSGGGLYLNDRGTWRLRGVISKALRQEDDSCNLNEYVVFTDTAQFLPWIRQVMNEE